MIKASDISGAARILKGGGLVAFPTETVYGLGADATQDSAVARIFAAKDRPRFNPLISHLASAEAAFRLGHFPAQAEKLAATFWPGPLTIVVERRKDCRISLLASAGLSSLALRVPSHPVALDLLAAAGVPVAAPSANRSGRISPTTADHVRQSLGDKVDMILDGGACTVGVESTVVGFLDGRVSLLRSGGIPRHAIEDLLGTELSQAVAGPIHAPGQMVSHYAPLAPVRLNATTPGAGEVYLGFGSHQSGPYSLSPSGNVSEAAANLFRLLHEIDATKPMRIAVAPVPETGLGEAINDRLRRAAAPKANP